MVVICEVSEGLAKAKKLAARELRKQLADALEQPLANKQGSATNS